MGKFIFSTGNISWNFWAWKEVFYGHQELLKENFKNILLLSPLSFLLDTNNKAKKCCIDYVKDFFTGLYQITIVFNYLDTLIVKEFNKLSVVDSVYLLYEGDYRKVIADAEDILRDYKNDYIFEPEKIRAIHDSNQCFIATEFACF